MIDNPDLEAVKTALNINIDLMSYRNQDNDEKDKYTDEFIQELLKLAQKLDLDIQSYKDICVKNKIKMH